MPISLPTATTTVPTARQTPAAPTYASVVNGALPGEIIATVNVPTLDDLAAPLVSPNLVTSIIIFWSETAFPVGTISDYLALDPNIFFRANAVVAGPTVIFNITGTIPGATLYIQTGAYN